jgi:hypothetical protein
MQEIEVKSWRSEHRLFLGRERVNCTNFLRYFYLTKGIRFEEGIFFFFFFSRIKVGAYNLTFAPEGSTYVGYFQP